MRLELARTARHGLILLTGLHRFPWLEHAAHYVLLQRNTPDLSVGRQGGRYLSVR